MLHTAFLGLTRYHKGGMCFLCIIYTYFRVPEPSGRTFAELDLLFEKRVSARKFAKTEVNVFDETVDSDVLEGYKQLAMSRHEKRVSV